MQADADELERRRTALNAEAEALRAEDEEEEGFEHRLEEAGEKEELAKNIEREVRRIRGQIEAEAARVASKVGRETRRLADQAKAEAAKLPEDKRTGNLAGDLVVRAVTGGDAKKVEKKISRFFGRR